MAFNYMHYLSLEICPVERSTVVVDYPAQVVVLRKEYPVQAGQEGLFTPSLEEGQRVKAGEQIGYIQWEQGPKTPVLASHSGVVSYVVDGWEGVLTPEKAENTDWLMVLEALEENSVRGREDGAPDLSAGRTVAKVVDNLIKPTLFFHAQQLPTSLSDEASCLFLLKEDQDGTQPLQASTGEIIQLADGSSYFFAELDTIDSRMDICRSQHVSIIDQTVSGIKIPLSALQWDERGLSTFVFTCTHSHVEQDEVQLLYRGEDFAIVEGLSLGDQVIANPGRAKEGQRIYTK
ncbi:MAG: HlyD family efflux transporter periplasmic adaptor subunit [Bacillota bacterium]|nr:HlyD family efflux transporter periplasmic adaptor subunit [Bacillota bacterium]